MKIALFFTTLFFSFFTHASVPQTIEVTNIKGQINLSNCELTLSKITNLFDKGQDQFKFFSIKPMPQDYKEEFQKLHNNGLIVYVRYLADLKNTKEFTYDTSGLSIEHHETLTDDLKVKIKQIILNDFIKDTVNSFDPKFRKDVERIHMFAVDATLEFPYQLFYHENKLVGFLSWNYEDITDSIRPLVTTHWINKDTPYEVRKNIHGYVFNFMKSFDVDYYLASIFLKNTKSMNLFKNNGYLPFYSKVIAY